MDPITQIYQRQVKILSTSTAFSGLVKISPNTLVDMSNPKFFQSLEQLSMNDTPRVVIGQSKFKAIPLGIRSTTADFSQSYMYTLVSNDLRIELLNKLKIITIAALTRFGDSMGMDGLIRGWTMAECHDVAGAGSTGSMRWMSYLNVTIDFYIPWTAFAAMGA